LACSDRNKGNNLTTERRNKNMKMEKSAQEVINEIEVEDNYLDLTKDYSNLCSPSEKGGGN